MNERGMCFSQLKDVLACEYFCRELIYLAKDLTSARNKSLFSRLNYAYIWLDQELFHVNVNKQTPFLPEVQLCTCSLWHQNFQPVVFFFFPPVGQKSTDHIHRMVYTRSLDCHWFNRTFLEILFWSHRCKAWELRARSLSRLHSQCLLKVMTGQQDEILYEAERVEIKGNHRRL